VGALGEVMTGMSQALTWHPLAPFGARVDLDLSGEISEGTIEELRSLWDEHHLLYFPQQQLSTAEQIRASGWFGPVLDDHKEAFISPDPQLGGAGVGRLAYHSDLACSPYPLLGLSLYGLDVTDNASSTVFIDVVAAAAALPDQLRGEIEDLHVLLLWPLSFSDRQRSSAAPDSWPGTEHPLLRRHPRTGQVILSLNENHTDRIVDLDETAGEALIQQLFAHLYSGAYSYEHRWNNGDFIVWDNIALQHGRPDPPPGIHRTLRRVELSDHGYGELMPSQVMAAYQMT
jgi:taurine dioxygenase